MCSPSGDVESLCAILERRGELAFDAQLKRNCYAEVGLLREQGGNTEADGDALADHADRLRNLLRPYV